MFYLILLPFITLSSPLLAHISGNVTSTPNRSKATLVIHDTSPSGPLTKFFDEIILSNEGTEGLQIKSFHLSNGALNFRCEQISTPHFITSCNFDINKVADTDNLGTYIYNRTNGTGARINMGIAFSRELSEIFANDSFSYMAKSESERELLEFEFKGSVSGEASLWFNYIYQTPAKN
ncbi:MAG: hypothetical protein R3B45_16820 [Bdellovibrionota bacterium]